MDASTWNKTNHLYEMWPVLMASRKRDDVRARKRKFRLAACALCRSIWDVLEDKRSRLAVEAAEQFADGLIDDSALAAAQWQGWQAHCRSDVLRRQAAERTGRREGDFALADHAGGWVANKDPGEVFRRVAGNAAWVRYHAADKSSIPETCDVIREVFGNPFRPVAIDQVWLTPTVASLAAAAYEVRILPAGHLESARLAILADALEEAGCSEGRILSHLRSPGPHVRGCWVVDRLTGRGGLTQATGRGEKRP